MELTRNVSLSTTTIGLATTGHASKRWWYWPYNVYEANICLAIGDLYMRNNITLSAWNHSSWSYKDTTNVEAALPLRQYVELAIMSAADTIVQPIFKADPNKQSLIYTAFDDGFLYQYPFDPSSDVNVTNCTAKTQTLLESKRLLDDDCPIPISDRMGDYEPRCRPWYT